MNQQNLKLPPNNLDVEEKIIASVFINASVFEKIQSILQPDDFYKNAYRLIFESFFSLKAAGKTIDVETVVVELEKSGNLQKAGGQRGLLQILNNAPISLNPEGHARILKECALKRQILTIGQHLSDGSMNNKTVDELLNLARDGIEKIQVPMASVWKNPVDLLSMVNIPPIPIPWLAYERIIQGRGFLLTGVGGSSKTRLLYHMAAGAILGRLPWSWEVSIKGRAVLVLTEDTADDVHRTIHSLSRSLKLSQEDKQTLYQDLIIYPLAGQDTILLSKTSAGTLEKSKLFLDLTQKIKDLGDVVFVGMDPALSLTDGDELDQGNQRALGKMADDLAVLTGAAVGLVTHATKGSLNQDTIGSHNSRGGGAITDAARTEFVMRTMTTKEYNRAGLDDPEEQFRHVQLVGTKGNYLPPSAYLPVWLRRDDYGMLSEANISLDQKRGPSEKDMGALSLLKDLAIGHDRSLKAWRESCVKNGVITSKTDEAQVKAMKRIVKSLKDFGLIEAGIGKGIWLAIDFNEDRG